MPNKHFSFFTPEVDKQVQESIIKRMNEGDESASLGFYPGSRMDEYVNSIKETTDPDILLVKELYKWLYGTKDPWRQKGNTWVPAPIEERDDAMAFLGLEAAQGDGRISKDVLFNALNNRPFKNNVFNNDELGTLLDYLSSHGINVKERNAQGELAHYNGDYVKDFNDYNNNKINENIADACRR